MALVPFAVIEEVKVVLPVEIEAPSLRVELLHLDVVVLSVPGHVPAALVAFFPAPTTRGSPEVDGNLLPILQEIDSLGILFGVVMQRADNVAVERPLHVGGGPFDNVLMELLARVEVLDVTFKHFLVFVDEVCLERWIDRGNDLHIDLLPVGQCLSRRIKPHEECGD